MDRTQGENHITVSGKRQFTNGPPGTVIDADHMNAMQEELLTCIQNAGLVPSSLDKTQLYQAVLALVGRQVMSTTLDCVMDAAGCYAPISGGHIAAVPAMGSTGGTIMPYAAKALSICAGCTANTYSDTCYIHISRPGRDDAVLSIPAGGGIYPNAVSAAVNIPDLVINHLTCYRISGGFSGSIAGLTISLLIRPL